MIIVLLPPYEEEQSPWGGSRHRDTAPLKARTVPTPALPATTHSQLNPVD